MAMKRGLDQISAWGLGVVVAGLTYGIGYGVSKVMARHADERAASELAAEEAESTKPESAKYEAAGAEAAATETAGEAPPAKEGAKEHAKEHASEPAKEAAKEVRNEAPEEPAGDAAKERHKTEPASEATSNAVTVAWDYKGSSGPDHWGALSDAYKTCANGKQQSPVDIDSIPTNQKLLPIRFHYQAGDAVLSNNGHTIAAQMQSGSYVEIDGDRYDLSAVQFHAPSEHKVAGVPYDFETQLVHKDAEGHLAIIALLYEEGGHSKALSRLWQILPDPGQNAAEPVSLDPQTLLPTRHLYYTYMGSLTTPPCSEGVRWLVMTEPQGIGAKEVDQFVRLVPFNARPVQPLHGRHVQKSAR